MAERLSRKALYDLVWSEPLKTLAARFGISDVALKKTCARGGIPTPGLGHWAKKEAGKPTFQPAFPLRPPGMDDEILVGGGGDDYHPHRDQEELLGPLPPLPKFPEPIEAVRVRIAEAVGRVVVPRNVTMWHPAVERLLKEDEKRREKQLSDPHPMSWNDPKFDSPFERRRLRILNSLFFAVAKMNGKSSVSGQEARQIHIAFFQQHFHLSLDKPKRSNRRTPMLNTVGESGDTRLCLSILKSWGSEDALASWQDDDEQKLETCLTDIAVQLILTAEIHCREAALRYHQWRVQRKAELEEEARKRKLEAERAEQERKKRLEQARVDRLLRDANAFQQAGAIRKYVEAIRSALATDGPSSEEVERWRHWALAQADRIDPAVGGAFLNAMRDEVETKK